VRLDKVARDGRARADGAVVGPLRAGVAAGRPPERPLGLRVEDLSSEAEEEVGGSRVSWCWRGRQSPEQPARSCGRGSVEARRQSPDQSGRAAKSKP
jgi:hypothetical protein